MQSSSRYYEIGGLRFLLDSPPFNETGFLSSFRTEPRCADIRYRVEITDRLPLLIDGQLLHQDNFRSYYKTDTGFACVSTHEHDDCVFLTDIQTGDSHIVSLDERYANLFGENLVMQVMNFPRSLLAHGGMFLHASFIAFDGQAILFTAPKQVGKSTQAGLWERYRGAEIINGDRALLRKHGGRWFAFGSPFCGTSGLCKNRALPVKAIVILSQAGENHVQQASVRSAYAALLDGCTFDVWDKEQMNTFMDLSAELIEAVPFYQLSCLPNESAIRTLEEVL